MGYGCGDSFPIDFESNGISFGSKSKVKLSPQSYPIRFERKWKYSFLSAAVPFKGKLVQSKRLKGDAFMSLIQAQSEMAFHR